MTTPFCLQMRRITLCGVVGLALSATAQAQNDPGLIISLGRNGPSELPADSIFAIKDGVPMAIGGGRGMGLGRPNDDISGLSASESRGLDDNDEFILCFEVDPFTKGRPRPERLLADNVYSQWQRRQQAGDAFATTEAFSRSQGGRLPRQSMGLYNNVLAVNQSAPYRPGSFGLRPSAGPEVFFPNGTPLDQVDASAMMPDRINPAFYFTLSSGSPSLQTLANGQGGGSAAAIFVDPDVNRGEDEELFARPTDLGLVQRDEIATLIIWDDNNDRRYNGDDSVIFSLTPDSPTLVRLGMFASDVFLSQGGEIFLFAAGTELGLECDDTLMGLQPEPLMGGTAQRTLEIKGLPAPGAGVLLGLLGATLLRRRRGV